MINLVLECIDRLHVYSSAAHFADVAGKEAGESWKSILNSLYELLGRSHNSIRSSDQHFNTLSPHQYVLPYNHKILPYYILYTLYNLR